MFVSQHTYSCLIHAVRRTDLLVHGLCTEDKFHMHAFDDNNTSVTLYHECTRAISEILITVAFFQYAFCIIICVSQLVS